MEREESLNQFKAYLRRRFPDRRTIIDYVSDLKQYMLYCTKAWRDVTMQDIDRFVDEQRQKGLKPATIKRRAAAIKTFFDFLAEESGDLNWPNPVRMKRHAGKQGRRLPRDLSDETVEKVWGQITGQRDRAWFALMLRAGLRVGEVASLKLDDILAPARENRPARLRVCGKGCKERMVLLTGDAYTVLQAWLEERPESQHLQVFLNERDGGPLSVNGIEYCLRQDARQAGFSITPHQLRHTYARQLTEAGMPVTSLGKLLGHAQISTTQIYTAGADPELAQAYQQAMQRVSQASLPVHLPQALPIAPSIPSLQAQMPPEIDWEAWGVTLPRAIQLATLTFVKKRIYGQSPHKQRRQAQKLLSAFHLFWTSQMKNRSIQTPEELALSDFWHYQLERTAQGVKAKTADTALGLLISLLRELAEQGSVIEPSIFRFRPRPRPEHLPRHLPESDAQQLENAMLLRLDNVDQVIRLENACYFVLAHTGLRAGELRDLSIQDLDLAARRLLVRQGKGLRDRLVYLSDTACLALKLYLGPTVRSANAFLFNLPNSCPISESWLYSHIVALGKHFGIPNLSPHRLRHTLATRLLNCGMEITRIQKLLGHEYVNTTMIYARVQDYTVEQDYRHAMDFIEHQQLPLSNTPIPANDWLRKSNANVRSEETLDNSV